MTDLSEDPPLSIAENDKLLNALIDLTPVVCALDKAGLKALWVTVTAAAEPIVCVDQDPGELVDPAVAGTHLGERVLQARFHPKGVPLADVPHVVLQWKP